MNENGLYVPTESERRECLGGKSCEFGFCGECSVTASYKDLEEEDDA